MYFQSNAPCISDAQFGKKIQVNFYHLNMEIWSKIIDDLVDIMFFKGIFFCQNAV